MKTRKLNKKGLEMQKLISLILLVALLILMFWGPLGSWWNNLSKKFNIFEKSVDDKIKDLQLLGPLKMDKKDLEDLAETPRGLKEISEVIKSELDDKCADDIDFKLNVDRVTNTLNMESEKIKRGLSGTMDITIQKSLEEGEVAEKLQIIEDTKEYICLRLLDCFKIKDNGARYEDYSLFATTGCEYTEKKVFEDYLSWIKEQVKKLKSEGKFEDVAKLCGKFVKENMLNNEYFSECTKEYNLIIPSKNDLIKLNNPIPDPFGISKDSFDIWISPKAIRGSPVKISISFFKDSSFEGQIIHSTTLVSCYFGGCKISIGDMNQRGIFFYKIIAKMGSLEDYKYGKINVNQKP